MPKVDMSRPATDTVGENIWQERFRIRSYEVDCHNRLSILTIFNFMQEAASRHAEALGVSIHQLLADNHTWLLSRLKICIAALPGWNDQIRVNTWPSGVRQLFALRDFELTDKDTRPLASAISAWLVIDLQKRRPVRIGPFVDRLKPIDGRHVINDRLDKLPALNNQTYQSQFVVRHADLDINQHVNNVKFVEWVIESLPAAVFSTRVLSSLEINFLAEAFHEDQILAACTPRNAENTQFLHSISRRQDGRELLRAVTEWGHAADGFQ